MIVYMVVDGSVDVDLLLVLMTTAWRGRSLIGSVLGTPALAFDLLAMLVYLALHFELIWCLSVMVQDHRLIV